MLAGPLTFSWKDNSDNETGFSIERSSDGVQFTPVASVAANVTTFVDTTLPEGARRWYRARAFNGNGFSGYTPAASAAAVAPAPENAAPTITALADCRIVIGTATGPMPFMIGDAETAATELILIGNASNPALVPLANITFGGSGAHRTVNVAPIAGQSGWSTIWVKVSDGERDAFVAFKLTVAENSAPTIAPLADRTIGVNGSSGAMTLTLGDETGGGPLELRASSSNPVLVPPENIAITGTGLTRTITVVPAPGQRGSATISITVDDGALESVVSFVVTVVPRGRPLNLSTRARGDESGPVTVGFVIGGNAAKRVLLRAVGPTLGTDFGIANALANPRLVLKRWNGSSYVDVAMNHDWGTAGTDALVAATAAVSAFDLPVASADAALLVDLPAGQYTALVEDEQGASGLTLVELYEVPAGSDDSRFVNVSTRGRVGLGSEVLIAGFVIAADGPATVLLRGVGPALAAFGVADALADPVLELYRHDNDGETLIAMQDNWVENPDAAQTADIARQVSAFPLPLGSPDAAFVITLNPGVYTAVLRGVAGGTGTALAEVYVAP